MLRQIELHLLQFLSSLCRVLIQVPQSIETTAIGSAMLAAIGSGAIENIETLQSQWAFKNQYLPEHNQEVMENNHQGWLSAIHMMKIGKLCE